MALDYYTYLKSTRKVTFVCGTLHVPMIALQARRLGHMAQMLTLGEESEETLLQIEAYACHKWDSNQDPCM